MQVRRHHQHPLGTQRPSRLLRAASALALAAAGVPLAHAGTIRDDVPDSAYTALAADSRYDAAGELTWQRSGGGYLGSATLITSSWVLTAGHMISDPTTTNVVLHLAGTNYTAASWLAYPGWNGDLTAGYDIGLVKLAVPVATIIPASRYTGASEVGSVGTSVGYGLSGTGLTGATGPAATKRAGQNTIDQLGGDQLWSDNLILCDFDRPAGSSSHMGSSTPLPLEYLIAAGDSGGGQFIDVAGQARVAGVNSFNAAWDGKSDSTYGDMQAATRIARFNTWIDDTISVGWNNASGGSFATPGNWAGGSVPGAADVAGFSQAGSYAVGLSTPVTNDRLLVRGGQLTMNLSGNAYSLTSPAAEGSVIVGKYSGNAAAVTVSGGTFNTRDALIAELPGSSGQVTLSGGATWAASGNVNVGGSSTAAGGTGTLNVGAGTQLNVNGQLNIWPGGQVHVSGSASAASVDLKGGLAIQGGGHFALSAHASGAAASVLYAPTASSVTIAGTPDNWTGKLDLTNNAMVVQSSAVQLADDLLRVQNQVRSGFHNYAWDGNGITSSMAGDGLHAVGVTRNFLGLGSFAGKSVDANSILLRYTRYGDATLDGSVDSADYGLIDDGYQNHLNGWENGDFNYDGVINGTDYALIDTVSLSEGNPLAADRVAQHTAAFGPAYTQDMAAFAAAVPEPATLGLLAIAASGLLARRRSRFGF